MISTAGELLAALEALPHAARLRFTAVTAHRLAARDELRPLLARLDALGAYERRLGALAALAAGDTAYLLARLGDLDPVVRRYALRCAHRLPVAADRSFDLAVEAAYTDAPAVVRADLARLLRDGRRSALAERLVRRARVEYGDRDAALLLAGCTKEFTARLLPEVAGVLAYEDWSILARRHAAAVLDHAERELAPLTRWARNAWWKRFATGLATALAAAPERVLGLLEAYGPDDLPGPVHDRLADLVAVDPERVARWFADPERMAGRWERTPGPAVMRRLVAAGPPSLPALGAHWFHRNAFRTLLRAVPPARRGAFLDAVVAAAPPRRNVRAHPGVLELLPAAERHARARAAVDAADAEGGPAGDVQDLLVLLPPDEARPRLLAGLATGDAEDRCTAWSRLILNAGLSRDPEEVAAVLARAAGRLAHERDPVRQDVLDSFTLVPAPLLLAAVTDDVRGAESLERLCLDALSARDCSDRTRDTVRGVAVTLLSDATSAVPAATLAGRLLEALTAHTGTVELGSLPRSSGRAGIRVVVGALGPWLDRSAARGDVAPLLALAASCGRRGYGVPGLRDRLEKALAVCPDARFGDVAAAWLADPATRGDRVAALLDREPSAVFLPEVLTVLAAERTDLLDAALAESPRPGGRFPAAGAVRALPPFRYADRWLPRQQEAAARLAAAAVADPGRGVDERAALLRAVAPVPVHGRALLRRYAPPPDGGATEAPAGRVEPALAAAALAAAAHTDAPESALRTLLDHAGDDGAAAAWSAAGRAARHARPSRVADLLQAVLTRETGVKVTVRKAAARLAVRHLPPAAATALLSRVARTPGVHPDVHATVVGLATALLPAEEMWALLEAAVAEGPEPARLAVLGVRPGELAGAHRRRFGALVAPLAFAADEETAGRALSGLADWARHAPEAGDALVAVYTDVTRPGALWSVSSGLNELSRSGLPHPVGGVAPGSLLCEAVDRLLARVAAGEPEGGGRNGDLPALRRLRSLLSSPRQEPRDCAVLARRLADEPLAATTRVGLLVRAVDMASTEGELAAAVDALADAVAGRPVLAAGAAEDLDEAHRYRPRLADPAAVLAVVRTLGDGGDLVRGLLAAALATALGSRQGWPEPCRAAVIALRRHPEPDVRELAYAADLSEGP
ncbi:hypothetical protein [Streptomyces roseolus]|uniref:hypothetical protein n=1 Tax=Streptomyces roseolus TaxID=67358 RepID=UPI0036ECB758